MEKLIKIICLLLFISTTGFGQKELPTTSKPLFFAKGGVGTSWIIMPKVYLVNPTDTSSAQILPTSNHLSGYLGIQSVIPLGKRWIFVPEIDFSYISGRVRIDALPGDSDVPSAYSQKLQSYMRIEVPLNFGLISSDNFWVTFGPVLFFTVADNKGFDAAVREIEDLEPSIENINLNSDKPVGLRFRMAATIVVAKGMYIDIKFDSDLKRDFYYDKSEDLYNMKMSLQSITVGFGYRLNRAGR